MNTATTTPQELADARFDAAQEEAAAATGFRELLEELTELPESEMAAELRKAQRGERSLLMSDAWDRVMRRATGELLAEASRLSRVVPMSYRVQLWDEVI